MASNCCESRSYACEKEGLGINHVVLFLQISNMYSDHTVRSVICLKMSENMVNMIC